jgi:hypothetical protein
LIEPDAQDALDAQEHDDERLVDALLAQRSLDAS